MRNLTEIPNNSEKKRHFENFKVDVLNISNSLEEVRKNIKGIKEFIESLESGNTDAEDDRLTSLYEDVTTDNLHSLLNDLEQKEKEFETLGQDSPELDLPQEVQNHYDSSLVEVKQLSDQGYVVADQSWLDLSNDYYEAYTNQDLATMEAVMHEMKEHIQSIKYAKETIRQLEESEPYIKSSKFKERTQNSIEDLSNQLSSGDINIEQLKQRVDQARSSMLRSHKASFNSQIHQLNKSINQRHRKAFNEQGLEPVKKAVLQELQRLVDSGEYKQAREELNKLTNDPIDYLMTNKKTSTGTPMPDKGAPDLQRAGGAKDSVELKGDKEAQIVQAVLDAATGKRGADVAREASGIAKEIRTVLANGDSEDIKKLATKYPIFAKVLNDHGTRANKSYLFDAFTSVAEAKETSSTLDDARKKEISELVKDHLAGGASIMETFRAIRKRDAGFKGLANEEERDAAMAAIEVITADKQAKVAKAERQKNVTKKVVSSLKDKDLVTGERSLLLMESINKAKKGEANELNLTAEEANAIDSTDALLAINSAVEEARKDVDSEMSLRDTEASARANKEANDEITDFKREKQLQKSKDSKRLVEIQKEAEGKDATEAWIQEKAGSIFAEMYRHHVKGEVGEKQGSGLGKFVAGAVLNYIGTRTGARFFTESAAYFAQKGHKSLEKERLVLSVNQEITAFLEMAEEKALKGELSVEDLKDFGVPEKTEQVAEADADGAVEEIESTVEKIGLSAEVVQKIEGIINKSKHLEEGTRKRMMERVGEIMREAAEQTIENQDKLSEEVAKSQFFKQMYEEATGKLKTTLEAAVDKDRRVTGTSVARQGINLGLFASGVMMIPGVGNLFARKAAYAGMGVVDRYNKNQLESKFEGTQPGEFIPELAQAAKDEALDFGSRLKGDKGKWSAGVAWGSLAMTVLGGTRAGSVYGDGSAPNGEGPMLEKWVRSFFVDDKEPSSEDLEMAQQRIENILDVAENGGGLESAVDLPDVSSLELDPVAESSDLPPGVSSLELDPLESDSQEPSVPDTNTSSTGNNADVLDLDAQTTNESGSEYAWASTETKILPPDFEWNEKTMGDLMLVGKDQGHYGISQLLSRQFVANPENYGFANSSETSVNRWAVLKAIEMMRSRDQGDWVDNVDNPSDFRQTHFTDDAVGRIAVIPADGGSDGYMFYDTQEGEVLTQRELLEQGFARVEGNVPEIDTNTITQPDYMDAPQQGDADTETPEPSSSSVSNTTRTGSAPTSSGATASVATEAASGTRMTRPEAQQSPEPTSEPSAAASEANSAPEITASEPAATETASAKTPERAAAIFRDRSDNDYRVYSRTANVNGREVEYYTIDPDESLWNPSFEKYIKAMDKSGQYDSSEASKEAYQSLFKHLSRLQEMRLRYKKSGEDPLTSESYRKLIIGFDQLRKQYKSEGLADLDITINQFTEERLGLGSNQVDNFKALNRDIRRVVRQTYRG